jgi:hypothetical protein
MVHAFVGAVRRHFHADLLVKAQIVLVHLDIGRRDAAAGARHHRLGLVKHLGGVALVARPVRGIVAPHAGLAFGLGIVHKGVVFFDLGHVPAKDFVF